MPESIRIASSAHARYQGSCHNALRTSQNRGTGTAILSWFLESAVPRPSNAPDWPLRPHSASSEALAEDLRQQLGVRDDEPVDVIALVEAAGWKLRRRRLLDVDGNGLQAGLLPSREHGFVITVDDQPASDERWQLGFSPPTAVRESLERFRLAHELAHTFFFKRPDVGHEAPIRHTSPGPQEEAFCDQFAFSLLVPRRLAQIAIANGCEGLQSAAEHFGAPLSAVIDSAQSPRPVLGGIAGVGGAAEERLEPHYPLFARHLSDSWLAWRERPDMWSALCRAVPDAETEAFAFLLIDTSEGVSVRVTP